MDRSQFYQFAQQRGCRLVENNAFGLYRGYPFSIHLEEAGGGALTVNFQLEAAMPRPLFTDLRRVLRGCRARLISLGQGHYSFTIAGRMGVEASFDQAIALLTDRLLAAQLASPASCPYCLARGGDILTFYKGAYRPAHRACLDRELHNNPAAAQKSLRRGSYLMGALGALLIGFVASLPSLFTAFLPAILSGLLFFFAPFGAYIGYILFRGRRNKGAFWVNAAVCFLLLLIVRLIGFYASVVKVLGLWLSVVDAADFYISTYTPLGTFFTLVPGLLAAAAGLLLCRFKFAVGTDPELLNLQQLASLVVPHQGPAGGAFVPPAPAGTAAPARQPAAGPAYPQQPTRPQQGFAAGYGAPGQRPAAAYPPAQPAAAAPGYPAQGQHPAYPQQTTAGGSSVPPAAPAGYPAPAAQRPADGPAYQPAQPPQAPAPGYGVQGQPMQGAQGAGYPPARQAVTAPGYGTQAPQPAAPQQPAAGGAFVPPAAPAAYSAPAAQRPADGPAYQPAQPPQAPAPGYGVQGQPIQGAQGAGYPPARQPATAPEYPAQAPQPGGQEDPAVRQPAPDGAQPPVGQQPPAGGQPGAGQG